MLKAGQRVKADPKAFLSQTDARMAEMPDNLLAMTSGNPYNIQTLLGLKGI